MFKYSIASFFYRNLLKPIFFCFNPEFIHDRMSDTGAFLSKFAFTRFLVRKLFRYENSMLEQNVLGLKFNNPVGLSAGFDKNAKLPRILPEVGFGHMEIGSITLEPYEGNPKPWLYRLKKSKALVVYYGLMNDGVKVIADRIKKTGKINAVLGISIAKTNCERTSTVTGGMNDYYECMKYLEQQQVGDYYTINISCPNTFGGEPFTTPETLESLLAKVSELKISKPVFVKMPIDLPTQEFDKLLQVCIKYKISGVVIGNLTKARNPELIKDVIPENVKGGISGMPTQALCNELISYTYKHYSKQLIIIGVGGIFSAEDAYEKIKRGATLLDLITGMIFQGPQLIGQINLGLEKLLKKDGYSNISEAIGAYHK